MKRQFFNLIITATFLFVYFLPLASAGSMMPEFLYEIGMKFYQEGRYTEALTEFKKVLLIEPNYQPALKYIRLIEKGDDYTELTEEPKISDTGRMEEVNTALELLEIEKLEKEANFEVSPYIPGYKPTAKQVKEATVLPVQPRILKLDENFKELALPLEIEQGKSIIISGKNIRRFLATQPEIISIEKKGADDILITGKEIGYTLLHVWDDNGRWTTEFLGVFPRPEGPTYEELMLEEEAARTFKLRYAVDWVTYESGRAIDALKRLSYSWAHDLALTGETPYGNFDSSTTVRSSAISTDMTYLTLGLSNGTLGPFEKFTLRGIDFNVDVSNMAISGIGLRGATFTSSALSDKLSYKVFWGGEGGGRYGNLSPSLAKQKDSFIEGTNLSFSPTKKQNYQFTVAHGYGDDRTFYPRKDTYDFRGNWILPEWKLGYEIADDTEVISHILAARYDKTNFNFGLELRNIDRDQFTITNAVWRQGESGGLLNLNAGLSDKLKLISRLDIYRTKLYPAEDNRNRVNEDLDLNLYYQLDPSTSLGFGYIFQNDLGKLSQSRYQSENLSLSKRFKFIKDIYTFINFYHNDITSYSSPASSYFSDRVYGGLRVNLIGELYYYLQREMNWLKEKESDATSQPNAFETGIDWSDKIGNSPFRSTLRFTYRDEEDTVSNLSLLSGEDYIEGYSQLTYQHADDTEMYASFRVRNVWADNPSVTKRVEADINAGMRYLWDTGFRWDSVGTIEGYVFKDVNSDGIRQSDEAPIEGIKIFLGKDKAEITDIFGHYRFKGVKGKKAFVILDTSTLPQGFVLTSPFKQEAAIKNNHRVKLDFGITSRSEISGIVFEDKNENSVYDKDDTGISGISISLENDQKSVTDSMGRFSFRKAATGKHTISIDINSIPINYLPQVSLSKEMELFEGMAFSYNIPLKKIKTKK